jgi:hypothetical protein
MAFQVVTAADTFTRPPDTTNYSSGDLVANSTTAGSVVPLTLGIVSSSGGSLLIRRARLLKSTVTTTNAKFRAHFFGANPAASSGIVNGDNAALRPGGIKTARWIGAVDIDMTGDDGFAFSDGCSGVGVPREGSELGEQLPSGVAVYALLEALAAYAPGNAEIFTLTAVAVTL